LRVDKNRDESPGLVIGIDAANLRRGGGLTHLAELLGVADPGRQGISKVIVWGGEETLVAVDNRPWLEKVSPADLNKGLLKRIIWQRFKLSRAAEAFGCDVLLVPGGSYSGSFRPVVTMSRNMLPFEWKEVRRYGLSATAIRLAVLRWTQSRSFRKADGLIFLTKTAKDVVVRVIKQTKGKMTIIPHGIDKRFTCQPREQFPISQYSVDRPFRILYVSIIDLYKHQWHVAEAVAKLRKSGLPVELILVGPAYLPALKKLKHSMCQFDPESKFVYYVGEVPHCKLYECYTDSELCLFASSCENMPNILLEGMASGLSIACSNRGPMPEVLGEAGNYFDPENPDDIARSLRTLVESPALRTKLANASFNSAQMYSWQRCAQETFSFLSEIAVSSKTKLRHSMRQSTFDPEQPDKIAKDK